MWSSCNEGMASIPADSLVEGDHSIAVAVVAANRATAAKAKIIRRFMGSLPVECAPTSTLRASCPKSTVLVPAAFGCDARNLSFVDLSLPILSLSASFSRDSLSTRFDDARLFVQILYLSKLN